VLLIFIHMKGVSIKDVLSQGEGDLHTADKGLRVLQMRMSAHFGAKKLRIFRNLRCLRTDKEGKPVRAFYGQGGQFFATLCGRLLWTVQKLQLVMAESEKKYAIKQFWQFFSFEVVFLKKK